MIAVVAFFCSVIWIMMAAQMLQDIVSSRSNSRESEDKCSKFSKAYEILTDEVAQAEWICHSSLASSLHFCFVHRSSQAMAAFGTFGLDDTLCSTIKFAHRWITWSSLPLATCPSMVE